LNLRALLAMCLLALAMGVAACGGDDEETAGSGGSEATQEKKKIRVGLVTDIGGLNDRSFNFLANEGLQRAKSELGVEGRVITSKSNSDYVPNLSSLAQQRYDLIIGVGFLMAEATNTVATKFPQQKFAIIDFSQQGLKNKPANVQGILFKEQEAGYLAGYMAGLYAKDNNADTVSTVGGQKIPPVDAYIAGYQAGAEAANPGIKTLNGYSRTSSTRRSARSSGSRRSSAAPASSSRWRASAASAPWTPPRSRTSSASAWTPTRASSASTSSPRRSRRSTCRSSRRSSPCRTTPSRAGRTRSSTSSRRASGWAR
jgi:basic membrane lipoprotein Med (substrate-binding protein (PBP1-ABC) superfamily)